MSAKMEDDAPKKQADAAPADDKKADAKAAAKGFDDIADATKPLKLTSKDKKEFMVERRCAFISTLVRTSLENGTVSFWFRLVLSLRLNRFVFVR
jgi:hypothetical protein